MLKNNIEMDVTTKCIYEATTQAKLAEETQTTLSYVHRLIRKCDIVVTNTVNNLMEDTVYDVRLTYEKRED